MKSIKKDFIIKEVCALAICMVLFAAALAYLIFYIHISPLMFLIIPLIIIAFVLRMSGQVTSAFRRSCGQYPESWQNQVEKEYNTAHPTYKVAYGEVHLMKTCVVCRNKRRLIFIPVEQIVKIEERMRRVSGIRVPLLKFTMDGGKTLELDFSAIHNKAGEDVVLWFIEQIGAEKVERSKKTVLR